MKINGRPRTALFDSDADEFEREMSYAKLIVRSLVGLALGALLVFAAIGVATLTTRNFL